MKQSLLQLMAALIFALSVFSNAIATEENKVSQEQVAQTVEQLKEPLYNPFLERYVIDELKSLRTEMLQQKTEFNRELTDRQLRVAELSATYATDTVTYFFYLIAATSSVLLLVGWNSLRDIRANVQTQAEKKVSSLISEYEGRLSALEKELVSKSKVIKDNQREIETTNEIQSLWLKAGQESSWDQKIKYYDQILELRPESTEALTYKADAALELGETQWAITLCNKALDIEPHSGHAYFQLACAYADLGAAKIAIDYLSTAIEVSEDYRDYAQSEERLICLGDTDEFKRLVYPTIDTDSSTASEIITP